MLLRLAGVNCEQCNPFMNHQKSYHVRFFFFYLLGSVSEKDGKPYKKRSCQSFVTLAQVSCPVA